MSSRWGKVQQKPQSYANLLLITGAVRTTAVLHTKEGCQLKTSIKEDFLLLPAFDKNINFLVTKTLGWATYSVDVCYYTHSS